MADEQATRASVPPGDEPIKRVADDRLQLKDYLFGLLRYLETVETPFVVGVFGGWGSGKTSFLNVMEDAAHSREYSENPKCTWRVVRVNPWECDEPDDAKRLLASSLWKEFFGRSKWYSRERLRAIGRSKDAAAEAVLDAGGSAFGISDIGKATQALFSSDGSLAQRYRKKFEEDMRLALGDEGRVLVLIDDLDRAPRKVIPEVLETIKLYLNEPGCVFVLAADPAVIAEAIRDIYKREDGESRISGEQYLEKIVQLPFYLPRLDEEKTASFFAHCSTLMCEERGISEQLRDLLVNEVLQRNPRAIKRFCMTHGFLATVRADLDAEKLAKALAVQMAFPVFFKSYHIVPGLLMRDQAVARGEDTERATQERWDWASEELGGQRAREHVDAFAQASRLRRLLETEPSFADERDCGTYLSLMSVAVAADGEPGDRFSQALAMLSSGNPEDRRQGAVALGELGDARAFEPLLDRLMDRQEEPMVREMAGFALGESGDARAVQPLLEVLADTEEAAHVRGPATAALGKLGDARALQPLIDRLQDTEEITQVRVPAAVALAELRDERAMDPLLRVLENRAESGDVRGAAALGLAVLGEPQALGQLSALLANGDESADFRRWVAWALGELGDAGAVPALVEALGDTSPDVRASAVVGLLKLREAAEPALPVLREIARDDANPAVANGAQQAVTEIEAALAEEDEEDDQGGAPR